MFIMVFEGSKIFPQYIPMGVVSEDVTKRHKTSIFQQSVKLWSAQFMIIQYYLKKYLIYPLTTVYALFLFL